MDSTYFLRQLDIADPSKYKDKPCGGVQIVLTDRNAFDPLETGLSIARELKLLFGDDFDIDRVNSLLFHKASVEKVKASTGPERYTPIWKESVGRFSKARQKYLLYE